ncbi:O-antigen ligase family protein [Winogradskyella sp. DF17]|uniref:O-antigen ligase family protein n=1 Tax=Winogradskyella pelagia TaxID=2819984 RepID=A0ABS3SZ60_9FLAO|nr:O-antigen ligase family protein [Winogradskyella sp. DF17]MBO3115783.1 O-antigen ligase family protein [Winogradskyella sp. DF17]
MKISKSKNGLILILFFTLLSFFDLLYPSKGDNVDRIVPQIGRAAFFGVMLVYLFNVKIKGYRIPQPVTGKAIRFLLLLFCVVSLLHLELLLKNLFPFLKVLYWIAGYYCFYYALVSGLVTKRHLNILVVSLVIIYFLVILRDFSNRSLWQGSKNFFVSNNSYHLLKLFPLVLLMRNKFTNVLILLTAIGIVLAFKRGALLAFSIAFAVYYFYILFKVKEKKLLKLIFGIGVFSVSSYYFFLNMDIFLARIEDFENVETAGSGRGRMFTLIINEMLNNDNPLVLLFGNGFYATVDFFQKTIGHSIVAHSDIMEFFFNYGLLGLGVIIFFFYRVFKLFLFFKGTYEGLVIIIWMVVVGLGCSYSINLFAPEMIYAIITLVILEARRIWILNSSAITSPTN